VLVSVCPHEFRDWVNSRSSSRKTPDAPLIESSSPPYWQAGVSVTLDRTQEISISTTGKQFFRMHIQLKTGILAFVSRIKDFQPLYYFKEQ